MKLVSPEEVCVASGELDNNKSCGLDKVPSEVFKYAPLLMHTLSAKLINMMIAHSYVPCAITDVKIMPVLKGSTLNPSDSAKYRPHAIATSASKLLEKVIFDR